jgi:hypothetical protein
MRQKLLPFVLLLATLALILIWISRDESLRFLQKSKYGTPRTICIDGTRIAFESEWIIDVIYKGEQGSPLLFGLLPIPVELTELKGETSQVLLRSTAHEGTLSIHVGGPNLSREKLVASCSANSFCSLGKSKFGQNADVMQVVVGATTWVTYLDQKIMIGVPSKSLNGLTGVQISSCAAHIVG